MTAAQNRRSLGARDGEGLTEEREESVRSDRFESALCGGAAFRGGVRNGSIVDAVNATVGKLVLWPLLEAGEFTYDTPVRRDCGEEGVLGIATQEVLLGSLKTLILTFRTVATVGSMVVVVIGSKILRFDFLRWARTHRLENDTTPWFIQDCDRGIDYSRCRRFEYFGVGKKKATPQGMLWQYGRSDVVLAVLVALVWTKEPPLEEYDDNRVGLGGYWYPRGGSDDHEDVHPNFLQESTRRNVVVVVAPETLISLVEKPPLEEYCGNTFGLGIERPE
ncbi:hypothetical protein BU16DRAFT_543705 [Lophium mytilinum]|uniref:Uncharacterized protein n=1 Tax=Lophium mytilinum TaxID=390894 RepID=A0A6A6QEB1_9PEZI|nr:hypothetical protein BU16DRAFT_543705 [Lophium mytilinum]